MSTTVEDTVEVPIAWLVKLIKLGKETDVQVYSTGVMNGNRADKTKLNHLKGYIESAEFLIPEELKQS